MSRINWGAFIGAVLGFAGLVTWVNWIGPAASWIGGTIVLLSAAVGGILWIFLWENR